MNRKLIFQGAAFAAVIAFVGIIVQAVVAVSLPAGVQVQPALPFSPGEFLVLSSEFPEMALGFYGADALFITGYMLVFAGLYVTTQDNARPFALIGLLAGILAGLMDAAENAYFVSYILAARSNLPFTDADFIVPAVLTQLKWAASFVTLFAFGVAFPRRTLFDKMLLAALLIYPVIGVLGIANPSLVVLRGLFLLVGMPLFAVYFWQESRVKREDVNP